MDIRILLWATIPCIAVSPLIGQSEVPEQHESRSLCTGGHPLPSCSSFWITEFGLGRKIANHSYNTDYYLTWDIGAMVNHTDRDAFGGTMYAGYLPDESFRLGVRGRYRRWITPTTTLDFSPGVLFWVSNSEKIGFSGQAGIGYTDWISLFTQLDVTHRRLGSTGNYYLGWGADWIFGLRAGSKPAKYAALLETLVAIGSLIYASLWWGSDF